MKRALLLLFLSAAIESECYAMSDELLDLYRQKSPAAQAHVRHILSNLGVTDLEMHGPAWKVACARLYKKASDRFREPPPPGFRYGIERRSADPLTEAVVRRMLTKEIDLRQAIREILEEHVRGKEFKDFARGDDPKNVLTHLLLSRDLFEHGSFQSLIPEDFGNITQAINAQIHENPAYKHLREQKIVFAVTNYSGAKSHTQAFITVVDSEGRSLDVRLEKVGSSPSTEVRFTKLLLEKISEHFGGERSSALPAPPLALPQRRRP